MCGFQQVWNKDCPIRSGSVKGKHVEGETQPYRPDYQVVRESPEPLPFDEIYRRVNAIHRILTKNPKNTVRNAISQSKMIINTAVEPAHMQLPNGRVSEISLLNLGAGNRAREAGIRNYAIPIGSEI